MTRIIVLSAFVLLLAGVARVSAQTEIAGTVTAVDGRTVTIVVTGELLPRVGDPVRLRFRDPVPGAGLVFLEGEWEVTAVRRGEVDAAPTGAESNAAEPQEGLVALIASPDPQPRSAVAPEPEGPDPTFVDAEDPETDEAPVAAEVREREDGPSVERRHWVAIDWGMDYVSFGSPLIDSQEPDSKSWGAMHAALGVFVLPNVAVSGYVGGTIVPTTGPGDEDQNYAELVKAVGATLFLGNPGDVPGDIHPYVQGGFAWYDVTLEDFGGDAVTSGTGPWGGAGLVFTVRRGLGIYVSGQLFQASYDDPEFDRAPARLSAGLIGIL